MNILITFFGVSGILLLSEDDSALKVSKHFKRQSHKMFKHTQTIRRQFADELFECV